MRKINVKTKNYVVLKINVTASSLTSCFPTFSSPCLWGFSCRTLPVLGVEKMVRQKRILQQTVLNLSQLLRYGEWKPALSIKLQIKVGSFCSLLYFFIKRLHSTVILFESGLSPLFAPCDWIDFFKRTFWRCVSFAA